MSDPVSRATKITTLQLDCSQSEGGWWIVSAKIGRNGIGGLVVSEATLGDALAKVPRALADLDAAANDRR